MVTGARMIVSKASCVSELLTLLICGSDTKLGVEDCNVGTHGHVSVEADFKVTENR